MYSKILLALDLSDSDRILLDHMREFARQFRSELVLLHVADGWVARNFDQLQLASSEEMRSDWDYLERQAAEFRAQTGLAVRTCLALGNPPDQIIRAAEQEQCDLIAMASHGHKILGDILLGSAIEAVRHKATIPLLIIPSEKAAKAAS